ncbi:MAG: ABC transporter permease [Gemmobacter sp.]|uniref:ABC transporter permease n=1 Tax=Gemmobacter sp. TaxID=1898957 RepID=UPI001A4519D5|nr:ABC transporter permease [Gemmobacter sp.]MBL8563228.1 ABC transporter permease [Gemmobacter sp.]
MNLSNLTRRPEFGSVLSLIAVIAFYVLCGGVNLGQLAGAASWVNLAANLGIVALPVGLLMIAGEIDISIGAMIPAGSMTVAILSGHFGLPITVGIAGALALGLIVGLVNGLIATRTSVPTLIITLGTLMVVQGLILSAAMFLTGNASVSLAPPDWAKAALGQMMAGKYQIIILWWAGFAAAFFWLLHVSPVGNWILAMGGDQTSARNAGIPTVRLKIALFMLSATAAAFVGVCGAIQFNSAQVSGGMGYIFNAICAIVVGGVLLTGGYGSVLGIVLGTITFAIVSQGIYFTQIERNWANLIIGITLLGAVAMNETFRKMALGAASKKKRAKA